MATKKQVKPEEKQDGTPEVEQELTVEQKIVNYIDGSNGTEVDLVPFLKSLYPTPYHGHPAQYLQQSESKRLRVLLSTMKSQNLIALKDESFMRLGAGYYTDGDTKTKHYTIENLKIIATK